MAANNQSDIFQLDIFRPIIKEIESACDKKYQDNKKSMRIIADHLRASVFLIAAGVIPSNKDRGSVLRRFIRRILDHTSQSLADLAFTIVDQYHSLYPELKINSSLIKQHLNQEQAKYNQTIQAGKRALDKLDIKNGQISGQQAFDLFQSHGLSLPTISKLAPNYQAKVDVRGFKKALQSHQQKSRTASKGIFKGGLAEHSKEITKLHTATHLLHQALRDILGDHVHQKGSNITNERLRFDFSHPRALTPQEIDQIESLVNQKIKADLAVTKTTKDKAIALKSGALAFFPEAYPNKVNVYSIGDYSKEICGGPHVKSTAQINGIKIFKQKSASAGVRRLYAKLAS
jgi:alanyl-tRNA synthetase